MLTVHLGDDVGDPLPAVRTPHVGAHHHHLHLHYYYYIPALLLLFFAWFISVSSLHQRRTKHSLCINIIIYCWQPSPQYNESALLLRNELELIWQGPSCNVVSLSLSKKNICCSFFSNKTYAYLLDIDRLLALAVVDINHEWLSGHRLILIKS